MALSIYIHIPYCLQRCRYCDFTTFEQSQILPPEQYTEMVKQEIRTRHVDLPDYTVSTIYFGGGTPSLIPAPLIVAILQEIANVGFSWTSQAEITLEINPATIDEKKLDLYLQHGINRFSVGAQTFSDPLLQLCGRKHSAADTRQTLRLFKDLRLNYSFDLLFALPGQTLEHVAADLTETLAFSPSHLSAYCLTVPDGHPMSLGRAPEDEQVAMFELIEQNLASAGILKYEISNFARPGFESRHNQAYWTNQDYWGLGLSSHSYLHKPNWGRRFWNAKSFEQYESQLSLAIDDLPTEQIEHLEEHEALTDFFHISLRTRAGLKFKEFETKFSQRQDLLQPRIARLLARNWLEPTTQGVRLTKAGELVSNQVFAELTFLGPDLAPNRGSVDNQESSSILES
jgi:oxygen-independent coproporphyrinogen-3 oxidase